MQRKIQTFRAATMDDALELVRRELGQDAVVVESKEIATRRMLPWPSTRQEIEISAELRIRSLNAEPIAALEKTPAAPARSVRTLAETMTQPAAVPELLAPIPALAAEDVDDQWNEAATLPPKRPLPIDRVSSTVDLGIPTGTESSISIDRKTLESLQTIVAQLERQSRPRTASEIPSELLPHYRMLIEADIDDVVARDLISKLRQHSTFDTMNSPVAVAAMLTAFIEREMRCAPPIQPKRGRRQVVTLIGPTGVGKTTTLAKLAGHFHLREGLRVGLVTVDNYRVGAIEQLRTYAEILQIPLQVASNCDELRTAIDELDDVDLVLIDTAGRSPFDQSKMNELGDMLRLAASDHVLLVLSLSAGAKMLSPIADQFAAMSPTSLVLTKLDETLTGGPLLSVAREIAHPVSYLTTGQDVPDQIEPAHPNRLARLILGRDPIPRETIR